MTAAPKLELRALRKQFDSFAAVDGVDLKVERGETVALLGPSGCGKSTILNMIVGLLEPSGGDILVDGVSVLGVPPQDRKIGLVFQDYAVFTHISVRRNLAFGLEIRHNPRPEIERAVHEVARLVGLTDVLDKWPHALGSSQLQRLAVGRALIMQPSLLLLDEPLSNVETELRTTMRQQLRELQVKYHQSVIYVTHDQIEALSLANKIAVMSEGKIRQFDTADRIYNQPEHTFVARFLGSPPMNLLRGELRTADNDQLVFTDGGEAAIVLPRRAWPRHQPNGLSVFLGVRPEALKLAAGLTPMIKAQVMLVEPMGPEKIVTLVAAKSWEFKVLFGPEVRLAEGEIIPITALPERICLFDAGTGIRLEPAESYESAPA
jgi:multiple sugar transport system ATP-binding protein